MEFTIRNYFDLPSMAALRAFERAAARSSFVDAARDLGRTWQPEHDTVSLSAARARPLNFCQKLTSKMDGLSWSAENGKRLSLVN
jgi:hypothetical protein